MAKPYANAQPIVVSVDGEWLIGVQTGSDTSTAGLAQMKRMKIEQLAAYIRSEFGAAWKYRGEFSSALPADPQVNDYFICVGSFTEGGQSFTNGRIYAYNGTTWDDISDVLLQYIQKSSIADNLTTNDPTKVLSAKQGKILNDTLIADVADLQQQIDAISGGITPKGTVATMNDLPAAAGHTGWMYYVTSEGKYKVSDGSTWLDFGTYPIYYFALRSSFPASGALNSLYIAGDERKIYWWTGTEYVSDTAKMAEIDGYYQEMTVGDAEQLVATQAVEDSGAYLFRTSGGSADIGNREDVTIIGGTLRVNQFLGIDWHGYRGTAPWDDVNKKVVFTASDDVFGGAYHSVGKIPSGHRVFVTAEITPSANITNGYVGEAIANTSFGDVSANSTKKIALISTKTTSNSLVFYQYYSAQTITIDIKNPQCIDLTAMFGSTIADYILALETANAGAGVAWFRRYFPKLYYPYNAGTLSSVKPSSHDTTGFNQWDEEWELGRLDTSTGQNFNNSDQIRAKNYIPVISGQTYYVNSPEGTWFMFYDKNKNTLSSGLPTGQDSAINARLFFNSLLTMPEECHYIRFYMIQSYGTVYKDDICINLSWSGTRNGEYEPFEKHSYALDDSTEYRGFPKLDADGNLYYDGDVYKSNGEVTRKYGFYTFTGNDALDFGGDFYIKSDALDAFVAMSDMRLYDTLAYGKCNILEASNANIWSNVGYPNTFKFNGNQIHINIANNLLGITDYTQETLQSALVKMRAYLTDLYNSGKPITVMYVKTAVTQETVESFTNPQIVNDWGTEEYVDERDMPIPVGHVTRYTANLRDKLQHLPMTSENGDGLYAIRQTGKQMELEELSDAVNEVGEEITVGGAKQLVATVYEEDDTPYNFRTSGGSIDIGDRETDEIIGGTLRINQVIEQKNNAGHGLYSNSFSSVVVSEKGVFSLTSSSIYSRYGLVSQKFYSGHKYLLSMTARTLTGEGHFGIHGNAGWEEKVVLTSSFQTIHKMWSVTQDFAMTNSDYPFWISPTTESTTWTGEAKYFMIIDLTAMFGSTIADYIYSLEQANAGAGVAWFKKYFPKPYYAYNAGSLESVKVASHDMTGFNQWDEEWELGALDASTGQPTSSSDRIRTKNFIPAFPNTAYYGRFPELETYPVNYAVIFCYDAGYNYLGWVQNGIANNISTTLPNTAYIKIYWVKVSETHEGICINLSWSGAHNGEYEPFEKHSYSLDSSTEYRGIPKLDVDGNLYYDGDIYKSSGDVTRKRAAVRYDGGNTVEVNGESIAIYEASAYSEIFQIKLATSYTEGFIASDSDNAISFNGLIIQNPYAMGNGRLYCWFESSMQRIAVKISGLTETVDYKNYFALNPLMFVGTLRTEKKESVNPFTNPQIVNDWGTEEYVDAGVADGTRDFAIPVGHNTKYLVNLRDKVQHLPSLYTQNNERVDGRYYVEQKGDQMSLKPMSGDFPSMHVGTADNLAGRGTVGAELTFRTSGGSADIGSGSARLDVIEGNTLMMNQRLVATPNASWHITQSVSGHKITVTTTVAGGYCGYQPSPVIPANHKLLMKLKLTMGTETTVRINPYGNATGLGEVLYTHSSGVYEFIFQKTAYISLIPIYGETVDATYYLENVMLIDLTQMFGVGNEPTTVDEFKALFPLDYYDYTEATPLNFKGTGLKTVGFNEFDGLCENGMWGETGKESASGRTRTTNLIRVIPNTKYYFCYPNSGSRTFLNFQYYDASGNALINTSITKNRTFTTPPNACYVGIFTPPDNFGAFDICINLSWSGIRDGETEPYWDSTLPLPITTITGKASGSDESVVIFPDGMNGIGNSRDELSANRGVIKTGVIDLALLNWSYSSDYSCWVTGDGRIQNLKESSNAMCTNYIPTIKIGSALAVGELTTHWGWWSNSPRVAVKNGSSTTTPTGILYYEVITPIEYTLDEELNLNYRVDDFGTEQLLPENTAVPVTAPLIAEIAYAMNAVDTIRNLDKNFTNLATLDGLIAIINSKCGVNIVRGNFDSANNKYTFS